MMEKEKQRLTNLVSELDDLVLDMCRRESEDGLSRVEALGCVSFAFCSELGRLLNTLEIVCNSEDEIDALFVPFDEETRNYIRGISAHIAELLHKKTKK